MNRIQFQPGMSLFELFERYGSKAQCEAALEQARWPQGFRCPRCGGAAHCVLKARGRGVCWVWRKHCGDAKVRRRGRDDLEGGDSVARGIARLRVA